MTQVQQRDGEAFDSMLRRFNRRVQQNGILSETRKGKPLSHQVPLRKKRWPIKKKKQRNLI